MHFCKFSLPIIIGKFSKYACSDTQTSDKTLGNYLGFPPSKFIHTFLFSEESAMFSDSETCRVKKTSKIQPLKITGKGFVTNTGLSALWRKWGAKYCHIFVCQNAKVSIPRNEWSHHRIGASWPKKSLHFVFEALSFFRCMEPVWRVNMGKDLYGTRRNMTKFTWHERMKQDSEKLEFLFKIYMYKFVSVLMQMIDN